MLNIYQLLFNKISSNDIPYCSWKNNHLLEKELSGEGDIDLLVHPQFKHLFECILSNSGFISVKSSISEYPFVYHYYGYDKKSNFFAHLHVYYKLVTGDSHLKNYRIPLELQILDSSRINYFGIKEASAEHQMQLYFIRKAIKQSSFLGVFLLFRESKDYDQEYQYIRSNLVDTIKDEVPLSLLNGNLIFRRYKTTIASRVYLKQYIRAWHRGVGLKERIFQLRKRIVNKLFFHKKKQLNGSIVAIVGLDGSGKSTAVEMIKKWLGTDFNVKIFHFGRPPATFVTLPLRLSLFIRKKVKGTKPVASLSNTNKEISLSTIGKFRYVALAYERSVLMQKAHRYSLNGGTSILDRYPSYCVGVMDSPRIPLDNTSNALHSVLQKIESALYKSMPPADLLFQFKVDVENAIHRNRDRVKKDKETDEEIIMRFKLNKGLKYKAISHINIDANIEMELVHQELRELVWKHIIATN